VRCSGVDAERLEAAGAAAALEQLLSVITRVLGAEHPHTFSLTLSGILGTTGMSRRATDR
jgi:hypothetical protein